MRLKRMPPNQSSFIMSSVTLEPVSRTYQYRKVMKPMLERKRRARINRCLDELKELMTGTLQSEGENVAKLEKADILELTVRHLHNLRKQNSLLFQSDQIYADRFWAGFRHCATEVSHFLSGVDQQASVCLLKHMNAFIKKVETTQIIHPQHQQSQPMPPSEGPSTHQLLGHPSIYPPISSNSSNLPNDLTVIRIPPPAAIPVSLQRPSHKTCMAKDEGGVWRPW